MFVNTTFEKIIIIIMVVMTFTDEYFLVYNFAPPLPDSISLVSFMAVPFLIFQRQQ
jgi:hypothetical protein